MQKNMKKKCFTNSHCCMDCPNTAIEAIDDRYGYGIAGDMGFEKIKCKDCIYETGECSDCLFYGDKECPGTKEEK